MYHQALADTSSVRHEYMRVFPICSPSSERHSYAYLCLFLVYLLAQFFMNYCILEQGNTFNIRHYLTVNVAERNTENAHVIFAYVRKPLFTRYDTCESVCTKLVL